MWKSWETACGSRPHAPGRGRTNQEVTGEVDPRDLHARPSRDLHVDDRQTDGDACATVEHLVQKTVARIVVLFAVTREAELVVEILVERLQRVVLTGHSSQARAGFLTHPIQRREVLAGIERGILDSGDDQGSRRQILPGRIHGAFELAHHLRGPRLQM